MDELVKEFLDSGAIITYSNFIVWLIEEKNHKYKNAVELADKHKGIIGIYKRKHIETMIMKGSRNSLTLKKMLEDEEENTGNETIVINFAIDNKDFKNRIGKDGK